MKFALDILWEKYGEEPFWLDKATPVVAEYLNVTSDKANRAILNSMVGGAITVIGSSETIEGCNCDNSEPHTHYSGNLQFKFYPPIWDINTPRKAP
jgi:hypothetical protein